MNPKRYLLQSPYSQGLRAEEQVSEGRRRHTRVQLLGTPCSHFCIPFGFRRSAGLNPPRSMVLTLLYAFPGVRRKWLISRRMVEISHFLFRNFLGPSEFIFVGAFKEKLKALRLTNRYRKCLGRVARQQEKGVHNEIPEICSTARVTGYAARLFAGCGHGGSRSWRRRRRRLCRRCSSLRVRILSGLSLHLRALRLLRSELVLRRRIYWSRPLVPRLGTSSLPGPPVCSRFRRSRVCRTWV
jgi:hypothetical protein